jgi:hypothetical protein
VTGDLVERLRAEIAQDELWALAASAPRYPEDGPTVAGGVHWTWSTGGNWDPIAVDPMASYVGQDGDGWPSVTLRTVEEWRLSYGGPDNTLPIAICEAEELRTGDGGHIVRHDPARVLRDVVAHRAILDRHGPGVSHPDECGRCNDPWPCDDVRALASIYFPEGTEPT